VRRRLVAVAAAPLLAALAVLAACGSSSGGGSSSTGTLPTVTGTVGSSPNVSIPGVAAPGTLQVKVVQTGTGPAVAKGDLVVINYVGKIWKTNKVFDSSFQAGRSPASFQIGIGQVIPGFDHGLIGRTVGSRVLLVIPPAQGYGSSGNSQAGIAGTDTIVFVVDILGTHAGKVSATGAPAPAPRAGLPKVSTGKGKPTITLPKTKPPSTLVVVPVLNGTGDTVRKGDLVVVQYVGVKWANGKQFDASWDRDSPVGFGIGVGQVIKGWDQGLVGKRVGDRVLLVVPPAYGYGAQGRSNAGISGTDTLVFAVDIIATYH
jgi:peptidylprolyl isomerase